MACISPNSSCEWAWRGDSKVTGSWLASLPISQHRASAGLVFALSGVSYKATSHLHPYMPRREGLRTQHIGESVQ